jgi:hypothetical protein
MKGIKDCWGIFFCGEMRGEGMFEEVCNYAPPKSKRQKIVIEDSHSMAVAAASSWSDISFRSFRF